jgi:hypothetical protein
VFLRQRDGSAELYARLVHDLRQCTSGIDRFASESGREVD